MKTGAKIQEEVEERLETPSPDLDGADWDPGEADGPLYTGMVAENIDPFVPAGALRVKIHEAETWEPPEGCSCAYLADGARAEESGDPCPADHAEAS